MIKKYTAIFLLCCSVFLSSCAQSKYLDTLPCTTITDTLTEEILGTDMYAEYSEKDVSLIFGNTELFDSCSIIYSVSSDDIGEVGIFHAKDSDTSKKLLEKVEEYIEDTRDERNSFVRNYMPEELDKLNYADSRRFGNYVVYTILSADESEEIFCTVKELLCE